MPQRFFVAYLTANEQNFLVDISNIYLMTKYQPGVPKIELFIAISEVSTRKISDSKLELLKAMVDKCPWMNLKKVFYKGNTGRDFSSAQMCIQEILKDAQESDMILVRNRSSIGPFRSNWYTEYSNLFENGKNIGLVGNTINLAKNLREKGLILTTHIQTYLYLSSAGFFSTLIAEFPGVGETNRKAVILNGELGLSKQVIDLDRSITCLHWKEEMFNHEHPSSNLLPPRDVKKRVRGLPFIHRESYEKYFYRKYLLLFFWIKLLIGSKKVQLTNKLE